MEVTKSVDHLSTSQSIEGVLDAKIASAMKRIMFTQHFSRRVNVEELNAQRYDRFLRGRQIAHVNLPPFSSNPRS